MDNRPLGPDYLILDNFANPDQFEINLSDLQGARREAENLTGIGCNQAGSQADARCDAFMWLQGLGSEGADNPALRKISGAIDKLTSLFNQISQADLGDKTLRVDK